jgi:hypothetical protein
MLQRWNLKRKVIMTSGDDMAELHDVAGHDCSDMPDEVDSLHV